MLASRGAVSGSFYALVIEPRRRRLLFRMGTALRIGLLVAWLSLTLALGQALMPGTDHGIDPEGWVPAGLLWGLFTLAAGWSDRWVFEAGGRFHRERGWLFLVHRKTLPLSGFGGWLVESHPVRPLDPAGRRATLEFRTSQGLWRIDSRFASGWLAKQGAALDLWTEWLKEDGSA